MRRSHRETASCGIVFRTANTGNTVRPASQYITDHIACSLQTQSVIFLTDTCTAFGAQLETSDAVQDMTDELRTR